MFAENEIGDGKCSETEFRKYVLHIKETMKKDLPSLSVPYW